MKKECLNCAKEIDVPLHRIKRGRGKYCSRKCMFKSENYRKNQSAALKGKYVGLNSQSYIDGRSKNRVYPNKKKALERDNHTCQKCGMDNEQHLKKFKRTITVDHIDGKGSKCSFPNHALSNLQTLCLFCHGKKDGIRADNRKTRFKKGYIPWNKKS